MGILLRRNRAPVFSHGSILYLPYLAAPIRSQLGCVVSIGERAMETVQDHRKCAEECVAMAQQSLAESDKALWLTLAQSRVRLAEHVERAETARTPAVESSEAS